MRRISVGGRLAVLVVLPVVLGIVSVLVARAQILAAGNLGIEVGVQAQLTGEQEKLRTGVEAISAVLEKQLVGVSSATEQERILHATVDSVRFGADRSGYFFVYRGTVCMIAPTRPELVGKDLKDAHDAQFRLDDSGPVASTQHDVRESSQSRPTSVSGDAARPRPRALPARRASASSVS